MPRELTKESILQLQETFKTFDIDGNGFVDDEEIEKML